jgi:hypothetical protein
MRQHLKLHFDDLFMSLSRKRVQNEKRIMQIDMNFHTSLRCGIDEGENSLNMGKQLVLMFDSVNLVIFPKNIELKE